MNDLQRLVDEFSEKTDSKLSLPYRALDLCAETGELAQEILRESGYGKQIITKVSDKTVAELGDSLFSLLSMANEMNVDVEEVLGRTLDTYAKRWQRDGMESSHHTPD
jgi:NTP pyrophosphatase (non-canonical NTP hydrolase)